jgi:glyoxylase-like metal-dependent hydrolase (beta-lactamase superfamily II)
MIAIASQQGIVVVDTESSWSVTEEIRRVIAREFGRDDFAFLINTHGHTDHGGGNQVFGDAVIVAHERCPEMLRSVLDEANLDRHRERLTHWLRGLHQQSQSLSQDDPELPAVRERARYVTRIVTDLGSDFELTLPHVTFPDRLTLDLGDLTVRVYYFGGLHTDDHVIVHVPEEGLLLTGDILTDSWIPVLSESEDMNIPLMLAHWETILQRDEALQHVVNGHWDLGISLTYFRQAHRYVRTLWDEIGDARSQGLELEAAFDRLVLQDRFPEFRELVHEYEGVD